ncbi:predicted protein [Histoplasma mississippiense (nom. inval.)]|uniref:predicted protein n=1 Tax=Ajellomyces capsulatus (strain NAm1 / WU24) TaxID=2059318 RepID=UPI000157D6A9|nr:predicted protein [Histoplasma mississippiense (nom. inval.)]EDN11441.1 predicted protein [Histoplasma mississippiense (nom. inval.)]
MFSPYSESLNIFSMDRQGTEDRLPLPSQLLSSGVLQSTVQACEMLDDLYQEALSYISDKSKPLAHEKLKNLLY